MVNTFYKKPNGEYFRFEPGRMKKSSCDKKYVLCDFQGKEIKSKPKAKKDKVDNGKE
tara:strand:+ start:330 stop:500 length:171 start_codon:yes stop_codon:yes gene_type:complete